MRGQMPHDTVLEKKKMRRSHIHRDNGVTLIEALIATVIVGILAIGGLSYQAFGAVQFHIAQAELTATRTGQLLIEDWKGAGAPDIANYNAAGLGVGFVRPNPSDNSYYTIIVDGLMMHLTLSYQDVALDSSAGVTLRQINVKVQWKRNFAAGPVNAGDPSIVLSTYARLGQD